MSRARRPFAAFLALVGALALSLGVVMLSGSGASAAPKPKGNNGTVKIAGLGDIDLIPDNEPHVPCQITVQWYNFDKDADIIAKVGFKLKAPTGPGTNTMSVDGPSEVFVGEDDPGGAGNDFDGEQVYTLSFTGPPHPTQGYHVKLTVRTPQSKGADVKHKVFWVQPCEAPTPSETPTVNPTESETPSDTGTPTITVLPSESEAPTSGTPTVTVLPSEVDAGLPGGDSGGRGVLLLGVGFLLLAMSLGLVVVPRTRGSHEF